jgi:hypothetical protein
MTCHIICLANGLQVWLGVYDKCKVLLPEVERLRRDADAALNRLQQAKGKVGSQGGCAQSVCTTVVT